MTIKQELFKKPFNDFFHLYQQIIPTCSTEKLDSYFNEIASVLTANLTQSRVAGGRGESHSMKDLQG